MNIWKQNHVKLKGISDGLEASAVGLDVAVAVPSHGGPSPATEHFS